MTQSARERTRAVADAIVAEDSSQPTVQPGDAVPASDVPTISSGNGNGGRSHRPEGGIGRPSTRPRRVARVLGITLLVLAFVGIPAARFFLAPEPEADIAPPTPVRVAMLTRGDAEETARYTGNLIAEATTTVLPRVGGRVITMEVTQNEQVQAGDVIARLEADVLRLQAAQARAAFDAAQAQYRQAVRGVPGGELEIARADVEQAEAALETARSNFNRSEQLFESGAVSRREYEETRDRFQAAETEVANARRRLRLLEEGASEEELDLARANLDAAARQLELAELQLAYATVRTPVDGTVARVLAEPGEMVGQQTALVAIVNDRLIYARIAVPERLYGSFRGREGSLVARIYPEAYPTEPPFEGTVSTVASVIDAASRTFEVEVAIPNDDGRLRPGMYVNALFVLAEYPDALLIPPAAVHLRDGRRVVYIHRDGIAEEREVSLRELGDGQVIVLGGLVESDQVIVEGGAFLADGSSVRVVEAR